MVRECGDGPIYYLDCAGGPAGPQGLGRVGVGGVERVPCLPARVACLPASCHVATALPVCLLSLLPAGRESGEGDTWAGGGG